MLGADQIMAALLLADAETAPVAQPNDIIITSSYDVFTMDGPDADDAAVVVIIIGKRVQGLRAEQEFASFGVLHTIQHTAHDVDLNETFALAFDHVRVRLVQKNIANSFSGVARKCQSIRYRRDERFPKKLADEPVRTFQLATVAFAPDDPAWPEIVYCVVELE